MEVPEEEAPVEAEAPTPDETPAPQPESAIEPQVELPTPEPTPDSAPLETVEAVEPITAEEPEAPEAPEAPAESDQPATDIAAQAEEAPTEEAAEVEGEGGAEVVRPSQKRRTGKVVGFIDPSQFQTAPKRTAQSRRLRSSDDVMPNVMPTFGRSRHSGQVRGDTTRGALTAQQLREREAGRFLRRRRAQGQDRGARRGGRGGPASVSLGSPFAGQVVGIDAPITLKKLANTLSVKENQVLKEAFKQLGFGAVNINSLLDEETAVLLAHEFDVELEVRAEIAAEEKLLQELADKREGVGDEELLQRPPTVAFLGHVDHGKTTLIDSIRRSRITKGESGGITQHIGAYQVTTEHGHTITIIDTPGHAAFTAMRARGAGAVDVVVLVVAADDGVKPQTEEAYNHAKAAGCPIVVAINKMDRPEANAEKVLNELSALGLTPEEWGGETAMLRVSALQNDGVEDLLERVFLESEVLELMSHPSGPASGIVLEAEIQQGKGKVAHLLVKDGNLCRGDVILAGQGYGKVRSIHDDRGKTIKEAGPSKPVEVTGLNELPMVGDQFHVVETLEQAQEVAEERARSLRQLSQIERKQVSRENIFEAVAEADKSAVNLIVKADVQGSIEVLKHQLDEFNHDEVNVKLVHSGVGAVLESDVDLAVTSGARIMAFHTSAATKVRQAAERAGVDIKVYEVIYELLDDVRRLMEGELAPEVKEEVTGHVEIRRVFKSSKFGNIAGCMVLDGSIRRSSKVRLLRDDQLVWSGELTGLRRESDDAKEVREGFECGVLLKNYNDIKVGDVIEAYRVFEVQRTL